MIPVYYNLHNLVERKATTAAALFGLALVVFVFASVMMMANGVERTLGRGGNEDVAVVLRKGSDAELTSSIRPEHVSLVLAENQFKPVKGPAGVAEVVAVILLDKVGGAGMSNVTVRGVQEGSFAFRHDAKVVQGHMPAAPDEVLVGKAIAGRFKGLGLNDTFELKKNRPVKVAGIFEDRGSANESEVWADVTTLQQTFGRDGGFSGVRVRLESPAKLDGFKAAIEQNKTLGLVVTRETAFYTKQSEGLTLFLTATGLLISFFVSLGAMMGAMITMHGQVATRQRELGTLRALGFTRFQILTSLLIESLILALAGGALGAGAAMLMSFVHISMVSMTSWSEIVFSFEPTPAIVVRSMVAAGVMGLVGGLLPAIRASRINPIEAMRA